MRLIALLVLLVLAAPAALAQSPFAGVWHGTLEAGPMQLRMELEVMEADDGVSAIPCAPGACRSSGRTS